MRTTTEPPHLRERNHFKALVADNPNYFGNLIASPRTPVLQVVADTSYEQLIEVAYHSAEERLKAVVRLSAHQGYGSDVTGPGSTEFVRFYLSDDGGEHWQDYGVSSFSAFNLPDMPAGAPVSACVSMSLPHPLLDRPGRSIRLRAILSWQACPPPDQPHWQPAWGNVLERELIARRAPAPRAQAQAPAAAPDPAVGHTTDTSDAPLQSVGTRRAYAQRDALTREDTALDAEAFTALIPALEHEAGGLQAEIMVELRAVALDPNTPECLVAIARQAGPAHPWLHDHAQFVSFWQLPMREQDSPRYLGSAAFSCTPECAQGYMVARLPVELSDCRRPGVAGPVLMRLHASLSPTRPLSARPPATEGNPRHRAEACLLLPPGPAPVRGKLSIVGGIAIDDIDPELGTTRPQARFANSSLPADELGRPCPFGGLIRIQGPSHASGFSYSIEIRPVEGGPARLLKEPIRLRRRDGTVWTHYPDPESGRYAYVPFDYNVEQLLAEWPSEGDDRCTITLWTFHLDGKPTGMDHCRIQLANSSPDCDLIVTPPDDTRAGQAIECTYLARDPWFGSTTLELHPASPDLPAAIISNTQTPPRGMNWSIPASQIDPGSHQLRMTVRNRTILDSRVAGRQRIETLGLADLGSGR